MCGRRPGRKPPPIMRQACGAAASRLTATASLRRSFAAHIFDPDFKLENKTFQTAMFEMDLLEHGDIAVHRRNADSHLRHMRTTPSLAPRPLWLQALQEVRQQSLPALELSAAFVQVLGRHPTHTAHSVACRRGSQVHAAYNFACPGQCQAQWRR